MKVYAVRNREGAWFRRVGYGGYGPSWVEDIGEATLYQKLSTARGRVSFFAGKWPDFGVPLIVAFDLVESEVMDETDAVKARIVKREEKRADYERRRKEWEAARPCGRCR